MKVTRSEMLHSQQLAGLSSQHHYVPVDVPEFGIRTRAYWSIAPPSAVLIFIHGFAGDSTSTWDSFPSLLVSQKALVGHDLVFYGYDGKSTRAHISAGDFEGFLTSLLTTPVSLPNASLPDEFSRGAGQPYKRAYVIAHSLGAVVTRLAMLLAYRSGALWTPMPEMVFYAPAHMGSNLPRLVKLVSGTLAARAYMKCQVLQDLDTPCQTLTYLQDETDRQRKKYGASILRANCIMFGHDENVVNILPFPGDPDHKRPAFPNRNHITVCKPQRANDHPLQELLNCL